MDSLKQIRKIIDPGDSWSKFFRKSLSTLLVASIAMFGYSVYSRDTRSHWEDLPLHVAIKKGDISDQVQEYLERLVRHDDRLRSVWVYSWPDARTLLPVASAGHAANPMPLGYFLASDYKEVGTLVMELCTQMERPHKTITVCPIMADNDAWGVIAFELKDGDPRPNNWRAVYAALTHKLSHIIYSEH